jgi:hypothetical protein
MLHERERDATARLQALVPDSTRTGAVRRRDCAWEGVSGDPGIATEDSADPIVMACTAGMRST